MVLPFNDAAALDAAFAANPGAIAGVILEPYLGNVGFVRAEPGYLARVRAACTAHGALLIFDEVMTGFRLARGGVQELERVTPDLTCARGRSSAAACRWALSAAGAGNHGPARAASGPVYQAGTLSGNPLALAAGIAALRLLDEEDPYARLDALGRQVRDAALAAARAKGLPLQVPQTGSMFSLFFAAAPVRDYDSALAADAKLFARFFHACLERGVYFAPSAYETAFLSTAHAGAAVARAAEVLTEAIREL